MLFLKQNCEKMENNQNPFLKNAEFKDQGYYTCVFFLHHNGKLFNVTKTFNITIVGGKIKFRIRKKQICLSKMDYFLSSKVIQEGRGNLVGLVTTSLIHI